METQNKIATNDLKARVDETIQRIYYAVGKFTRSDAIDDANLEMVRADLGHLQYAIESLLAEIEALRKEREWQAIETAPKDGTEILAICKHNNTGRVYIHDHEVPIMQKVICFSTHPNYPVWIGFDKDQWHPTHWMPLPTPPAQTQGGDDARD